MRDASQLRKPEGQRPRDTHRCNRTESDGIILMSEKEVKDKRHKHTSVVYEMTKEIEIQCFVE